MVLDAGNRLGAASGQALVVQADALRLPLPDESADAIVCDPPYGLEFMGKEWDKPHRAYIRTRIDQRTNGRAKSVTSTPEAYVAGQSFQAWCQQWAAEALRVLKPGGWLLAFGGARTWHRLACGIEDAGFEVRDTLMWLYGQGFPKGKACLKPGYEPILLARKPGSSVLQIDAARIGTDTSRGERYNGKAPGGAPAAGWKLAHPVPWQAPAGRWPANVVLTHAEGCQQVGTRKVRNHDGDLRSRQQQREDEPDWRFTAGASPGYGTETVQAWECAEGCPVALLDQQSGTLASGLFTGQRNSDKFRSVYGAFKGGSEGATYGDTGGASRFFYTAKADASERVTIDGEGHPTVKPLALVRWLVRLVTPPGGLVLDMFGGSGTTGEAAMLEGFTALVVDKDPASCAKAKVRAHPYVRRRVIVTGPVVGPVQGSLL